MTRTLIATLDGQLHDVRDPLIRPDDLGVLRADGVFDVARCVNGKVIDLSTHLQRLSKSAAALDLERPDETGYRRAIRAVLSAWNFESEPEATLRMVLTRGPVGASATAWVAIEAVTEAVKHDRQFGVDVITLNRGFDPAERMVVPWQPKGVKTLGYTDAVAALRYARAQGVSEVIFLTPKGQVLEGATSAVILERDGKLLTPDHPGILSSTTIRRVDSSLKEQGQKLYFQPLTAEELYEAHGLWLVSSGRLLAPVTSIDSRRLPRGTLHSTLRSILFGGV